MSQFTRITKRQAIARFKMGLPIVLCPCKFILGYPFSMTSTIMEHSISEYKDKAKRFYPTGNIEKVSWDLMYNNWKHYNTSYETGYYAHYYVEA